MRLRILRLAGFCVVLLLSLLIALYAFAAYSLRPVGAMVDAVLRATFEAHRTGIYLHVFASAVALALGPFQFSARLRRRVALHRWLGRIYLGGVLIGGLAGLFMAFFAFGGLAGRLGFGSLALAWLYTGLRGYRAIRSGQVEAHRRWMIRNFALTFAAVTLRLWIPVFLTAGVSFETAYPVIAWLSWVPNLLVAELLTQLPRTPAGSIVGA